MRVDAGFYSVDGCFRLFFPFFRLPRNGRGKPPLDADIEVEGLGSTLRVFHLFLALWMRGAAKAAGWAAVDLGLPVFAVEGAVGSGFGKDGETGALLSVRLPRFNRQRRARCKIFLLFREESGEGGGDDDGAAPVASAGSASGSLYVSGGSEPSSEEAGRSSCSWHTKC